MSTRWSRTFRDVADSAYPVAQRNVDQNKVLVRAYARGLNPNQMAVKLIEDGNPQNLDDAIDWVSRVSVRHAVSRLGFDTRNPEPMEIGESHLPLHPTANR